MMGDRLIRYTRKFALMVCDRTNYDSRGNAFCPAADIGFCLEEPPIL